MCDFNIQFNPDDFNLYLKGNQFDIFKYQYKGRDYCIKKEKKTNSNIHIQREFDYLRLFNNKYFPKMFYIDYHNNYLIEEWIYGNLLATIDISLLQKNMKHIIFCLARILDILSLNESRKIIHRDIKPKNIMYNSTGIILLDFGSAEYEGTRKDILQKHTIKLGNQTHQFQPYEQLTSDSKQDSRVDVFASAVTIFWILEGKLPYSNSCKDIDQALQQFLAQEYFVWKALKKYSKSFSNALFNALRVKYTERSHSLWDCYNSFNQ